MQELCKLIMFPLPPLCPIQNLEQVKKILMALGILGVQTHLNSYTLNSESMRAVRTYHVWEIKLYSVFYWCTH